MLMISGRFYGRLRSFHTWTAREKAGFPLVWLLLGFVRLIILLVPFRHWVRCLGNQFGTVPVVPLLTSRGEAIAISIGKVVRAAAAVTPWNSDCLPQAVTARILLGFASIPCSLFFGVARDEAARGPLTGTSGDTERASFAHAWVSAGRIHVTGGESFSRFAVLSCFGPKKLLSPIHAS
jgi:hypothetical protein